MPASPHPSTEAMHTRAIAQGHAMVQIIQAAQVLLANSGSWPETALLRLAIALYRHRLRRVIAELPPDWSTEILAASESIGGSSTGRE